MKFQSPRTVPAVPAHVQDVQPRGEGVPQDRAGIPTKGMCEGTTPARWRLGARAFLFVYFIVFF